MTSREAIRVSYSARQELHYYDATSDEGVVFQPDVYTKALLIARQLGATRIVDFGCGDGQKLLALVDDIEVIGIDHGRNIEYCASRYPKGKWIAHDLDSLDPVTADMRGALLLCSDVIEHVRSPNILLNKLLTGMREAIALVISTPERELTHGLWHNGPPPNKAHVREWSILEFGAFLRRSGITPFTIGLTRSNTVENHAHTILAAHVSDASSLSTLEDCLIDAPLPAVPEYRQGIRSVLSRTRRRAARVIAG